LKEIEIQQRFFFAEMRLFLFFILYSVKKIAGLLYTEDDLYLGKQEMLTQEVSFYFRDKETQMHENLSAYAYFNSMV
jgi:hypothetical protein